MQYKRAPKHIRQIHHKCQDLTSIVAFVAKMGNCVGDSAAEEIFKLKEAIVPGSDCFLSAQDGKLLVLEAAMLKALKTLSEKGNSEKVAAKQLKVFQQSLLYLASNKLEIGEGDICPSLLEKVKEHIK